MKIVINTDLKSCLEISDKKAINSWDKNLTKKEMIENISLKSFEPNKKNAIDKLSTISRLINEDKNLQIQVLNLDIRGRKKSVEFRDIWDNKNFDVNILENITFVFKLSEPFLDEFNSFVIFTKIKNISQQSIEIIMNRIEYMNIPFIEKEIEAVYNGTVTLDLSNENNVPSKDPNLIDLLYKSRKIDSNIKKNNSKEKFRFQDWNDLIYSLNNFFSNKDKTFKDEIFVLEETLTVLDQEKDFNKKTIFLCQESKTQYSRNSRNLFLDDGNDKSIPIKIISNNKIDLIQGFVEKINNTNYLIEKLNVNFEKISKEENNLRDLKNNKKLELSLSYEKNKEEGIKILEKIKLLKNDKEFNEMKDILDLNKLIQKQKENNDLKTKIEEDSQIIMRHYNDQISVLSRNKKEDLEKIELEKNKIDKYNNALNYLSNNRFNSISQLTISSNYGEKSTDKRSFKINNLFETLDKKGKLEWVLTNKDIGKIQVIKRYSSSFQNINRGFYKNPYLFYSLLSIPEINKSELMKINKWKKVKELTKEKYKLNDDQNKVVEKSINMRDIFYLQGPPGTGKTQTICAITEEYTSHKNNVLMTSSTHEAINNFFDRLNEKNMSNPNLILLKYRANFPEEQFGENTIYKLFLEKICNFTLNKNDGNNLSKEYEKYVEKYGKKCPILPSDFELELLQKEFDIKGNINSYKSERFNHIFQKLIDIKLWETPRCMENLKLMIEMEVKNIENNDKIQIQNQLKDWTAITKSANKIISNFKEVEVIFEKKGENFFEKIMGAFERHINKNEKSCKNLFLEYIKNNRLINVIGISTTSKTSFEILGENINLFSEYPIDLVIIDEISKSTTPEILGRVILAKKAIFAGDYKQLPPITEFSPEECEEFFESQASDKLISEKELKDPEGLYDFIDDLHTTSFFKCEIESVKKDTSINIENRPYHNLKIQHRFTNNIMNCVNLFYDYDEQLQMPQDQKKWNTYELGFQNSKCNRDLSLFDTSYMNKSFANKVQNSGISLSIQPNGNYSSFDSSSSFLSNDSFLYPSKINEYNALVIMGIIEGIVKQMPMKNLVNKIGIICMTKSQKKIIEKQIPKELLDELKIKIDTVDNFQGRERDIIIVDFVRSWNSLDKKHISYNKRNLKFYTVLERINVALSRAESKLILVGAFENHYMDSNTIGAGSEKIDFFTDIYKSAKNLDSIIKTWEGLE